ncbi:hypothetical protein [Kiloniella antarctica]|uniref:Uncharacterized protein n=1 Tax=Kiloniella antarctica TaxID=1550907 RepID=A0ABW5BHN2_9PROT
MSVNGEILGSLLWVALILINLLGGLMLAQARLVPIKQVHNLIERLSPHKNAIGLTAAAIGIISFILTSLSLNLFAGIIPQVTALLVGIILAQKSINEKKDDVLKKASWSKSLSDTLDRLAPLAEVIGLSALAAGIIHFIFQGSFYFI